MREAESVVPLLFYRARQQQSQRAQLPVPSTLLMVELSGARSHYVVFGLIVRNSGFRFVSNAERHRRTVGKPKLGLELKTPTCFVVSPPFIRACTPKKMKQNKTGLCGRVSKWIQPRISSCYSEPKKIAQNNTRKHGRVYKWIQPHTSPCYFEPKNNRAK